MQQTDFIFLVSLNLALNKKPIVILTNGLLLDSNYI